MERTAEVLTLAETSQLLATRRILSAAEHRVGVAAYAAADASAAAGLGRLAEALSRAGDGLFDVLNVASSYAVCAVAHDAIDAERVR